MWVGWLHKLFRQRHKPEHMFTMGAKTARNGSVKQANLQLQKMDPNLFVYRAHCCSGLPVTLCHATRVGCTCRCTPVPSPQPCAATSPTMCSASAPMGRLSTSLATTINGCIFSRYLGFVCVSCVCEKERELVYMISKYVCVLYLCVVCVCVRERVRVCVFLGLLLQKLLKGDHGPYG